MENNSTIANNAVRPLLFLITILLTAGCHKEQVQVYNVPNDQQASQPATPATPTNPSDMALPPGHPDISSAQMPAMPPGAGAPASSPLSWTLPVDWREIPPSEMRVASFTVTNADGKQADVSIVPLSGMGGGDFANVNRCRGQVGLPNASDDELQSAGEDVEAAGQPAKLYDIAGKNSGNGKPSRILAAIQHRGDTSWYFKMMGDGDLVEQQKPAFISFLKSLSFAAGQAQSPATQPASGDMNAQSQLPPGHPDVSGMPTETTSPAATTGQPSWQVPAGWQAVDGGPFLVAKFALTNTDGTTADVNVSSAGGTGGGLEANVNRWRGQLGLPPISEILTTTFSVDGGEAQVVDVSGTNAANGQPAAIIGIIVSQPGTTWFYKLMGDPKLVASQRDAFKQFVEAVKY
jgi:hypothetical protein